MKAYASFSELALFNRGREAYVRRYIEGIEDEPTREMKLGSIVHKAIEDDRYLWLEALIEEGHGVEIQRNIRMILDKMHRKRPVQSEVAMRAAFKIKEGAKWWLGNGVIVYIFLWLIVWTIFYNAYVL